MAGKKKTGKGQGPYATPKLDAARAGLQAAGYATPRLDKFRTKLQGMSPEQRQAGKAKLKARLGGPRATGGGATIGGGMHLGGGQGKKKK